MIRFLVLALSSILIVVSGFLSREPIAVDDGIVPESRWQLPPFATAGYATFAASLQWVEYIFGYADRIIDRRTSSALPDLLQAVCALDTNWLYPRLVAGWTLDERDPKQRATAIALLEDGARRFPQEWRFRLQLAQLVQSDPRLDSVQANTEAARILLPLSQSQSKVPPYARDLAFTLLQKGGKPDQAMDILVQTYRQVPDPLIRFQFQGKIADLLRRNEVSLGAADSADFLQAIAGMLDSNDPAQIEPARQILVALVRPETRSKALVDARALARDFRAYREASASGR